MRKLTVCAGALAMAGGVMAAEVRMPLEETLVYLKPDVLPVWASGWTNRAFVVGEDSLTVKSWAEKEGRCSHRRGMMFGTRSYFPEYCASGKARVAFEYRTTAPKASVGFNYAPMLWGKDAYVGFGTNLVQASEWTPVAFDLRVSANEGYESDISWTVPKGGYTLEIRKLRVTETAPEKDEGRVLWIGEDPARGRAGNKGTTITEIALLKSADEMTLRNERRAAMMLRFALYRNGYRYLPIREYASVPELKGRILVGRAAEGKDLFGNDFFTDDELETVAEKDGTGAWAVKGGAIGVTGNCPGGPQLGAFLLLKRLGIEYLATDTWHCEGRTELAAAKEVKVPAIPYRSAMNRWGMHPELRGMLSHHECVGDLTVGAHDVANTYELSHDSLGFIVSMREYDQTHPEFFALQKDGTRMDAKRFHLGHCQFCWSNPELKKEVIRRYLAIMRGNPGVRFFCFAPGDGGGRECTCENCRKRGDNSTALVELMNEIGAAVGREFPRNAIFTYSYATTLAAPKVDHVDPHVKFTDSIYMPSHWPASQWFDHPSNARGIAALADWRKVSPDMGVMGYYESCGQVEHVWPAFWGWVALHRDFARHGAFYVDRTYGNLAHACCIANTSACGDAAWYVIPQVEIDPDFDVEAALARHFRLFFGAAAEPMRRYFDALNKELVDRDWVENCEWTRRGFITPENAERFIAILDACAAAAEKAGDPALQLRVKRERHNLILTYLKDVNRGRGNVTSADYPKWAHRVKELIELSRETHQTYFGYMGLYGFFANSLLYKLENTRGWWLNEPQLDKIVADPEAELGGAFPNVQEKTEKGVRIPVKGLQGGELQKKEFWKADGSFPAVLLRRESSGKGVVLTALRLEKVPEKGLTLKVGGIDGPTDGPADFELKVNGKSVAAGKVPWKKDAWSESAWTIPASALKVGTNDFSLRNATKDFEKDGDCGAAFAAKRNYYRGWFLIREWEFE